MNLRTTLAGLLYLPSFCSSASSAIKIIGSSTLGKDPQTVNRLNGESFQQDALITFDGFQYAAFYDANTSTNESVRYVSVARRAINFQSSWETLTLKDYEQTLDDGHDIISIGVSRLDGTLHLGFDQHDDELHYRISQPGVATNPANVTWSADIFGEVMDFLPGLESLDKSLYFINVTYPRFLTVPQSAQTVKGLHTDLLFELRVGRSGLGDDWLYYYTPGVGWTQIGRYLEGVNNNAYINGMDFDSGGNLHVTWTYRDYVNDIGQDVAVEAGPNGPENNHDMDYAFSPDLGFTWLNNWNQTISNTSEQWPIVPHAAGITIFGIPKYGGILNQEAQTVDSGGRVHVLNRENTTGTEQWYHYWRSTTTHWTRTAFPLNLPSISNVTRTPTVIGKRGKIIPCGSSVLALLPSNAANSTALSILRSTSEGHFRDWQVAWESESGCVGEPLFDRYRLDKAEGGDGVLSLFLVNGTAVQVLDMDLTDLC